MTEDIAALSVRKRILHTACKLFMEQGFKNTTMRQIADAAQVGLGLIDYYFGSKENLAISFYEQMRKKCMEHVNAFVDYETDPYSHLAMMIYLEFTLNMASFYKLYYDCLQGGIFEKYIMTTETETLERIMKVEHKTVSHDLLQLYSVFVCSAIERTLVLNKPHGLFPSISYHEIPAIVFRSSVGTFSADNAAIEHALDKAQKFVYNRSSIIAHFKLEYILDE